MTVREILDEWQRLSKLLDRIEPPPLPTTDGDHFSIPLPEKRVHDLYRLLHGEHDVPTTH